MKKTIFVILIIFLLAGCSTEQVKQTPQDIVQEEVTKTPTEIPIQEPKKEIEETPTKIIPAEPKKEINWYTSSHYRAKNYYCKTDPQWKTLSKIYLEGYNTKEELLKAYPDRKLHKPC
jgi:hypothetical protein|tara:strand:- start:1168 stop:1521 length:354 start_codon:yes stop_codon:yes gene_type:complete